MTSRILIVGAVSGRLSECRHHHVRHDVRHDMHQAIGAALAHVPPSLQGCCHRIDALPRSA